MKYSFDEFTIDTSAFEIRRNGEDLAVEPKVLDLLILLVANHDRALSKEDLLAEVWNGRIVSDATLSTCIKSARKLLGDDGTRQKYIRTIHGRGFRFNVAPEVWPDVRADAADINAHAKSGFARPQTRYARSSDVHIAYQLFGEGPANLVLAPGFVSHIDNYWDHPRVARWLRELASFARVAMFDKRGTGLSDQVPDLPGMDERMDDVRAVMDAVGFERAAIMGISEGGSLSALFAASHPDRCQALILYGAFAQFTSWFPTEEALQGLFDYIETSWGTGTSLPQFAPSMAGDASFTEWWGKFERLGATPGAAIALMRMNSQIDLTHILESINVPTLVIHRREDVLIDVEGGETLATKIPGARYVELSGPDHIPWVGEGALEIPRSVRDFLSAEPAIECDAQRVLATVLVMTTDVAKGRSALAAEDEQIIAPIIARYRGGEIIKERDATLVTFDGPARALNCAREIASTLKNRLGSLRSGMHTGEVEIGPRSVEGLAVQIAGGIAHAAEPQEVLVSRTVSDLVAGSGVELVDAGTRKVDGMPDDWRLYRVGS
ncbi:MAG: alpha/beta fold hydrolase [Hyphomicrobiaceae bacterium]